MTLRVFAEWSRLAWPLAKRDILARYRGSLVGVAWALVAPLAMVAIYALVFQGVFQARWGGAAAGVPGDGLTFVTRLFAGLMIFTAMAEVATRATRLVQDNANLVKRVVFPLELLVLSLLMQVGVHLAMQAGLLAALLLLLGEGPRWSWLALVPALLWLACLQYAAALLLAALGCYLRDLQHLVPVAMGGLLFLSPVFYPSAAAPAVLRAVLAANPVSAPIEIARAAWFGDSVPWAMIGSQALVLVVMLLGARWLFRRLRPGFADLV